MAGLVTHTRSRNLWFRQVVPERHRKEIGRSEIKLSLGTSEPEVAKARHAALQAEWRQRFQAHDQKMEAEDVARAPALVAEGLRRLTSGSLDNTVLAITKFLAFRLVTSWGQEFYEKSDAESVFQGVPDDEAFIGSIDEAELVAPADRLAFVASLRAHERTAETQGMGYRRAAVRLLESRRWSLVEPEIMLIEGATGACIKKGSRLFDAVAEALLVVLTQHRFEAWDEGSLAAFPLESSRQEPVVADKSTAPVSGLAASRLSEGLLHWRKMQMPAHQSSLEVSRSVDRFIDLFGDMAVGEIRTRHILDYRDLVAAMPRNLQLGKIRAAGKTLRQMIDDTAGNLTVARLSPTSVKKDVGGLQAVLAVLKQEQWISDNVAADVRIAGYSKRKSGGAARREPYTEAMMVKLFASPMYTGCLGESVSKRAKPGPHIFQDALYWLPLIGATGGPRLEEVGQARLDDVETIDLSASQRPNTGTCTILRITDAGPDQHLKTDGSRRVLIVHPELIKLGFLDYVSRRRAEGAERLFDLTRSSNEKWTKELSRQLNRYLDATVTDDPRYVFYSLRHEFKDCADDSGIDPKLSDKITGHAPGSIGASYGRGASIRKLALEIDKLDTSYIDWARLRRAVGRA